MACGTEPGATEQNGLGVSVAQRPDGDGPGVAVNCRAWPGANPSWPVSTTLNAQPGPGVPNSASGSAIVMVLVAWSTTWNAVPTEPPPALVQLGAAKPWASTSSLQAPAAAMV